MFRQFASVSLCMATVGSFSAHAETVSVRVDRVVLEANRPALSPVWFAFHDGSFDFFDTGQVATGELKELAELGDHTALRALFAGQGVDAVAGQMPLTRENPTAQATLEIDPSTHRFLSLAAMVLPSNDTFYGNDDSRQFEIFDAQGRLKTNELLFTKTDWWDAGSEFNDKSTSGGAAFVLGADPHEGVDSRGTVTSFAELSFYNGAILANGERFETLTQATDEFEPMIRITIVPEPSSGTLPFLFSILCFGYLQRRRCKSSAADLIA